MDLNFYANKSGEKTFFPLANFDMKTAEIIMGKQIVPIYYAIGKGWFDDNGNQYRVTSKTHRLELVNGTVMSSF